MSTFLKTGFPKKIIAILVAVFAIVGVISVNNTLNTFGEEPPPAPATSKTITDNGDGTHTLSLSVTGSASSTTSSNMADVIIVFDRSGSMRDSMSGNGSGTAPQNQQRLTYAKAAANAMAETLLALNSTENPDAVRVSLVSFAYTARTDVGFTTDLNTFQVGVNNLSASGGTNWEDALQTANNLTTRDAADVHVIFVSDGDPTVRLTRGSAESGDFDDEWASYWGTGDFRSRSEGGKTYYGTGNSDPKNRNYNYALAQAQTIVNAGKNFYSIGVSNDVTRMQGLATAVGQGDNYYHVTNEEAMNTAFSSIVSSITSASNFQNVVINDGITAATSSVVLSDGATASDYTYTITSPGGTAYAIKLDESGNIATINGATDEVTLTDSILNSYTLRVGDTFPAAAKSGNGVQWDLSDIGRLLNGFTYTVSFTVWPSQEAYDTLADLLNGTVSWDDVDQTQYTRTDNGDGTYSYGLRTNTNATVSYDYVEEVTGEDPTITSGESTYDDVPSISLTATTMAVTKAWVGEMPTNTDATVTFQLYTDGVATGDPIILNNANNWSRQIYIAPGIQVGDEILETGHDYTIEEVDTDGFNEYYYEFVSATQHPMIIDGTLTLSGGANALIGTNYRKSNLNITKTVDDISVDRSADPDEMFTFEIEVTDSLGDDVWFSIGDGASHMVVEEGRVSGATAEIQGGELTGYYSMPSGGTATVQIKRSENIYFTNLPVGTTYSVTEVDLPMGYTNVGITGTGNSVVNMPEVTGTISVSNTTYNVAYVNEFNVANVDQEILATKKVEGRDAFEQFEFALIPSASTQAAIEAGEIVVSDGANTAVTTTAGFIAKDGQETVSFGKYSFFVEGTYTFTIDETTTTTASGWTYDANTHEVTVRVTKNSAGSLVASISNNNPVFTNSYEADPVLVSIPVEKISSIPAGITAPDIARQFTFTLTEVDDAPMPTTISVLNPAPEGGVTSFGPIMFTEEGTYYYDITETGYVQGYNNDPESTKRIAVVVTDGGNGQLVATVNNGRNVTFINTYSVDATTASIVVRKNLVAEEGLTPPDITGAYTFTLKDSGGNILETKQNPDADGGTVTFSAITYNLPGTYTYTVEETGSVNAVTNDPVSTKTVTVTVIDNFDGTLTASVSSVEFNNTYAVQPTTASIVATKTLTAHEGLNPPDITGEYSFTLKDSVGSEIETKQNPESNGGTVTFSPITYELPGTYTYTVEETGEVDGVTNDPSSTKTVTVTVTDNGDGTLTASATSVTFNNTYDAAPVNVAIPVSKVLAYAEGLTPPDIIGKYQFTISAVAGAPLTNTSGIIDTSIVNSPSNEMAYEEIQFTTPGSYYYVIRESNVGEPLAGVTNDPEANTGKRVRIDITDNREGQLVANIVAESGDGSSATTVFTNTYRVNPTTAQIPVEKILSSAEGLNAPNIAGQFTFTLAAVDSAPLPDSGSLTITNPTAVGGVASFDSITYTTAGTYRYAITESGSVAGVANDNQATKEVTVVVTDNSNGTLTAVVNNGSNVQFTNTYSVEEVTVAPYVRKVMDIPNNLEGPAEDEDAFTFTISAADGVPLPETTTVVASSRGETKQFGGITFTEPGVYRYIVTESGTLPGVTNDALATSGKQLVITVTDNGQGQLVAVSSSTADEPLTFTNVYAVEQVTGTIPVNKELTGKNLEADAYEFVMESTDEGSSTRLTAKNAADGTVTFESITFEEPGEYHYSISEVNGGQTIDGITYDGTVYNVTATVTDDTEGKLSVSWSITVNEQTVTSVTFTNEYNTEDAKVAIKANKSITGDRDSFYEGETYTFTLTGVSENTEGSELTAVNNQAGEITFEEITYTQAGTYEYDLRETSQNGNGITVDESVHRVIVTVTDNGTGNLVASVNYPDGGFTFINTYTLEPVSSGIDAYKKVTGMELEAGEYTFVMEPGEGAPGEVQTVTNDEFGGVSFAEIEFTKPGTYSYTVREIAGDKIGVTYDATPRSAVATVTDNLDGTLSVFWETGDLTFVNSYAEATVRIGATKTIRGRDWNPEVDIYEFTLKSEDGQVIQTVTNDTAGNITFDPFTLYEPGEYTYTIEERPTSVPGVTEDPTVYTVKVIVTEEYVTEITGAGSDSDSSIEGASANDTEPEGQEPADNTEPEGEEPTNEPEPEGENPAVEPESEGEDSTNGVEPESEKLEGEPKLEGEVSTDGTEPEDEEPTNEPEPEGEEPAANPESEGDDPANAPEPEGEEPAAEPVIDVVENVDKPVNVAVAVVVDPEPEIRVLKAEITYLTDDEKAPVFVNTYSTVPNKSSVTDYVEIEKILTGRDLQAGEFTFVMRSETTELTATNDVDGNVVFDAITFTEPGTYGYSVSEVAGNDANIEYDRTAYNVFAEVVDNLDGTLSVEWLLPDEVIEFKNTWNDPTPTPTPTPKPAPPSHDGKPAVPNTSVSE